MYDTISYGALSKVSHACQDQRSCLATKHYIMTVRMSTLILTSMLLK